ncbi:NAD(P)H-binding protein [Hymenobacter sp. BT664]|uniref:NAD(P)H-binding protein n=1 Tax=Hymenobacter montanus TaxID=2771359 RepID=A0A927BDG0_9BACT|nr:NAD(P)H-binding protein [Hymenobacter montanus]MBD2768139.1 NAD(P)H-binding protein [Hymenobacter montanus]
MAKFVQHILVINAQLPSARLFCQVAGQAGYSVTAYLTDEPATAAADSGVRDLLERDQLAALHVGQNAVVFFWEGSLCHPRAAGRYLAGLRNVVYAMHRVGLTRLVVTHTGRNWRSWLVFKAWCRRVGGPVADQVQALLQASNLRYLWVTAGAVRDGAYRTRTTVTNGPAPGTGQVNRLDLVDFLLQSLYRDRLDGTAVHVAS